MNMEMGLYQQQRLKLAMTPELNQAIALLQYPAIELAAYIDEKALENPLIEPVEEYPGNSGRASDDTLWINQISEETVTLISYLRGQIPFKVLTDKEEEILVFLIDNIDENGYLRISLEEARSIKNICEEDWDVALSILQALEPEGVGARSLNECLLLQARRKLDFHPLLEKVLIDYFDLLVDRKWKQLAKLIGVTVTEIQSIFDLIQQYNPKPGASFITVTSPYSMPDVSVSFIKEIPVVKIFSIRSFKTNEPAPFFDHTSDDLTKRYMNQKRIEVNWLKKAIEQREDTLKRITHALVERQFTFFQTGNTIDLKPLTMKEIAKMVDVHESTVSRAIKDKMIETPFGTFDMKRFFSNGLATEQVEQSSSEQVKQEIVRFIKDEQKTAPLSDQAIADLLQKTLGVLISRRTIAKYRNQLKIPSSSKRIRYEISE